MDDEHKGLCVWKRLKILIDKKDRRNIKKDIGEKMVKLNKELEKEFIAWCLIFNGYKDKLVLANSHFIQFKFILEEIKRIITQMRKISLENNRFLSDNEFAKKLNEAVHKLTAIDDYKTILEIINSKFFLMANLEELKIVSNIRQEIGSSLIKNIDGVSQLIAKENIFFESEINKIKDSLDQLTDVCENLDIFTVKTLSELKEFLDKNTLFLSKNIK